MRPQDRHLAIATLDLEVSAETDTWAPGSCSSASSQTESLLSDSEDHSVSGGLDYQLGYEIEGRLGSVRRAMDNNSGYLFAVRLLDLGHGKDDRGDRVDQIEGELERLRQLRHPHLARVFGHVRAGDCLHIHHEYMAVGSMAMFLRDFGALGGPLLPQATRGLVLGLHHLHMQSPPIAHGNIRGATVLVDGGLGVKLADCGRVGAVLRRGPREALDALPWTAPEVVQERVEDELKADIWSLGCTVIELATAQRPWGDDAPLDRVLLTLKGKLRPASDVRPPIPQALPSGGRDAVRRCLQSVPADRPSAEELLAHPFVVDGA